MYEILNFLKFPFRISKTLMDNFDQMIKLEKKDHIIELNTENDILRQIANTFIFQCEQEIQKYVKSKNTRNINQGFTMI